MERSVYQPKYQIEILHACILSTLLYAAECWSLTERDEARLDAFDMRCQRKILRIKWSEHVTNKHIRSVTKQPQLTNLIRNRRLKWFGHLLRMDSNRIPKRLHLWKPSNGRQRRGRPRTKWIDVIQRDLRNLGFGWTIEVQRWQLKTALFGGFSPVRQPVQICMMLTGR